MAYIAQYAKIPFDQFVITMYPAVKSKEPEMLKADAKCTIDYLIHKSKTEKRWSKTCFTISTDLENFVVPSSRTSSKKENSNDQTGYYFILLGVLTISGIIFYVSKMK